MCLSLCYYRTVVQPSVTTTKDTNMDARVFFWMTQTSAFFPRTQTNFPGESGSNLMCRVIDLCQASF